MKLLVIGHSVADTIEFNGEISLKPGGIFYSVTALNNLKDNQDKISLITAVDEINYSLFKDEYEKLDEKFFNNVNSIPRVYLKIKNDEERHEAYENINQNLILNLNDLDKYDGILINMITGFDITLEQLKSIRKNYKGLIYFDVHTLSRGLDVDMNRYFRVVQDFNEWAKNLDFIQVNENEVFTLGDKKSETEIAAEMFSCGIKYLIITMGERGAKVFYKENNVLKYFYEPAINIDVKNKVGCGDVFGASFFYNYIVMKEKNIEMVLRKANIAAGFTASYKDIRDFKKMKNDVSSRFN